MNDPFSIKDSSFVQDLIDNIDYIAPSLVGLLDSEIVGNKTTFTVGNESISEGDPVFLQGDGTIQSAYGKLIQHNTSITPEFMSILPYSTNRLIILFEDTSDSNNLKAVIAQFNSQETSFTFSSAITIVATNPSRSSMTYDSINDRVIFEYASGTTASYRVGTITGTTLTLGAAADYYSGASASTYGKVVFDSYNNRVFFFFTEGTTDRYRLATTNDTTLTLYTIDNLGIGNFAIVPNVIFDPSTNRILVSYSASPFFQTHLLAIRLNTGSNTATAGSPVDINSLQFAYDSVAERIILYKNISTVCTVKINPTLLTITFGPDSADTSLGGYQHSNKSMVYNTTTNNTFIINAVDINTISVGASDNISVGSVQTYNPVAGSYRTITQINNKLVIILRTTVGDLGYFILVPHVPFVPFRFVGISVGDYTAGSTAIINYVGINDKQIGLIPGQIYYLGDTELTTQIREILIGRAVSSTEILFSNIV